jgi:lysophospholipase L1-like esterase
VPQAAGAEHAVPFTLPIGSIPPYTYMAFGDSLTAGDGSSDGNGYRNRLREKLSNHFGLSYVINEGVFGSQSDTGARRLGPLLDRNLPAYTLILYGVNDWNDRFCRDSPPCFTIESLRSMIREARSINSLPVLSTLPPANEGINERVPPERNIWVRATNERIKALGREERVPVADPYRFFAARTPLSSLFVDHVHPTDEGYEMIAQAFFEAISQPLATGSSAGVTFRRAGR